MLFSAAVSSRLRELAAHRSSSAECSGSQCFLLGGAPLPQSRAPSPVATRPPRLYRSLCGHGGAGGAQGGRCRCPRGGESAASVFGIGWLTHIKVPTHKDCASLFCNRATKGAQRPTSPRIPDPTACIQGSARLDSALASSEVSGLKFVPAEARPLVGSKCAARCC